MTLLAVLQEPDPRLRKSSRHIDLIDHQTQRLARDMLDTMYHRGGCGLAAPQVNARLRIVVVDTSSRGDSPLILVNPVIGYRSVRMVRSEEGCLSIPGLTVAVHRPSELMVSALDLAGRRVELEASGWLGAVIQHEIDHLDGRLLTDALSQKNRNRYFKGQRGRR
jgi:peptide deformylase